MHLQDIRTVSDTLGPFLSTDIHGPIHPDTLSSFEVLKKIMKTRLSFMILYHSDFTRR